MLLRIERSLSPFHPIQTIVTYAPTHTIATYTRTFARSQTNLIYELCTISGVKVTLGGDIIVSIPRAYTVTSGSGQVCDRDIYTHRSLPLGNDGDENMQHYWKTYCDIVHFRARVCMYLEMRYGRFSSVFAHFLQAGHLCHIICPAFILFSHLYLCSFLDFSNEPHRNLTGPRSFRQRWRASFPARAPARR